MSPSIAPELANPTMLTPPEPFGYKTAWFAIPSDNPTAVAAAIELQSARPVNWRYGVRHAYEYDEHQIFVSPPVSGWILVVGTPVVWEADDHAITRMVELSHPFGETQLFGSVRTSDSYLWARARNGKLLRLFYEGDGNRRVEGEPTEAEKAFQFFDPSSPESEQPGYWERNDLRYVDETCVLEIAGKWSVDPSRLDQMNLAPALGLLGSPSASYPPKPAPIRRTKSGFFQRLFSRTFSM